MTSFALVDLQTKRANRDHTGGFGSHMHADGFFGQMLSRFKENMIQLPVMHFGYLKAIIEDSGNICKFYEFDTNGEDIILIASSMHCYEEEVSFAKKMKAKYSDSKVGFFGPFCKTNPELFRDVADFLIFGEVEQTIQKFINGEVKLEGEIDDGIIQDLTTLPEPRWDGFPVSRYNYFPLLHKRPFMAVQSSRGCSYNCDFCPYMVSQTKKYRKRTSDSVIKEIEYLIKEFGVKSILFRDIVFTINRKHVIEICDKLIEKKINIEWACETRLDLLDEKLIDKMYESGFRGVNLGIETGNVDILKESGKISRNIEKQEQMVEYMKDKGVRINAFYMLGLIGDTPESMNMTIKYAEKLNTLGAQFCTMTPFPGTPLYEEIKNDIVVKDFSKYDEYQPVVDIKTSSFDDIRSAASRAFKYYLRTKWFFKYGVSTSYKLFINLLRI